MTSDVEKDAFKTWLLDNTEINPQEPKSAPVTTTFLAEVDQTVAHYCRNRHNDWSEDWIRRNLNRVPSLYNGWVEDLILLCKSHHEGYEALISNCFNPRLVPGLNLFIHLRYLACVLRVADVIEFDPERTPSVIFYHRDITPASRIFWWKDQEIAWLISHEGRLTVCARPPNAAIHHAIDSTVQDVERELRVCWRVAQERSLSEYGGAQVLPHHWHLGATIHKDVYARDSSYHYIDGTFRPNTQKLLALLGGIELYGDKFAAIRELLQNAFDAVREQVARQQLIHPGSADLGLEQALQKSHFVRIRLEDYPSGRCLICSDSGSGMSKEIIERYFLVSGESYRPDIQRLRQACQEKGISLLRSAQFGIGALSYFLLAKRVVVKTRRAQEAGDAERCGWIFQTEGTNSFGELRPANDWPRGTEVCFFLHDGEASEKPADFSRRVASFVKASIRYTPCTFIFESLLDPDDSFTVGPGWSSDNASMNDLILQSTNAFSLEGDRKSRWRNSLLDDFFNSDWISERHKGIVQDFILHLRWFTVEEELPGRCGLARISIPWFDYKDGGCLAYFSAVPGGGIYNTIFNEGGTYHGLMPMGSLLTSWKGIAISLNQGLSGQLVDIGHRLEEHSGIIEIDFWSEAIGLIRPHRQELRLTELGREVLSWCRDQFYGRAVLEIGRKLIRESREWAFLTRRLVDGIEYIPLEEDQRWVTEEKQSLGTFSVGSIEWPVANEARALRPDRGQVGRVGKERVQVLPEISLWRRAGLGGKGVKAVDQKLLPILMTKITWIREKTRWIPVPVFTLSKEEGDFPFAVVSLPPGWDWVLGVEADLLTWWNRACPVVRGVTSASLEWAKDHSDPRAVIDELLGDRSKACAWLTLNMSETLTWVAMESFDKSFIRRILKLVGGKRLLLFSENVLMAPSKFFVLSVDGLHVHDSNDVVGNLLSEPDSNWLWKPARK